MRLLSPVSLLQEAAAPAAGDESEEEDEFVYNPLKLPLGWDGKPIPYWLYKLHGLNLEFKCEICGECSWAGAADVLQGGRTLTGQSIRLEPLCTFCACSHMLGKNAAFREGHPLL